MKKALLFALVLVGIVIAQPSHVQAADEQISEFNVDLTIDTQGSASVKETITYDFGDDERRGIFRNLPNRYYIADSSGYEVDPDVTSVKRDGNIEPFSINNTDTEKEVKIGDSDVTITGKHTYEIKYELETVAIDADDGTQIIRFDAPGVGWEVPVNSTQINLKTPFATQSTTCYIGEVGSTKQSCNYDGSGFSAQRALNPGETITAEWVFPVSTFSQTAKLIDFPRDTLIPQIILGTLTTLLVAIGGKSILSKIRHKSRKREELIIARYEPPQNMTAADIGLLIDNKSDGVELSASVIDLAIRGQLKINLVKEKRLLRWAEYKIINTAQDTASLPAHLATLHRSLFKAEANAVSSKSLAKSDDFAKGLEGFHKDIAKRLNAAGFYHPVSATRWTMDDRMTDTAYTAWAHIAGFREFLSMTEKDRLAFHDAPERQPEQFSAMLPYAIALGVEKQWAKQFEDLNVDISDWYSGGASGISNLAAASALSNNLNSIANTASHASSGSSGSGGGFSGGGFGGGGGGSW